MTRRGTCILTGGAGGIGASTLVRLAAIQRKIVILTRSPARAQLAVDAVDSAELVDIVKTDIGSEKKLEKALSSINSMYRDIDTVIHAAAATDKSQFDVGAAHQVGWRCLKQIFDSVRHQLVQQPHGRVIAIGSIMCERPDLDNIAYVTAKMSLMALIHAIARDTLNQGITANLISPSSVATSFGDRFRQNLAEKSGVTLEQFNESRLATLPGGRVIPPDAVAALLPMLLGPSSAYMTGENIRIAGVG